MHQGESGKGSFPLGHKMHCSCYTDHRDNIFNAGRRRDITNLFHAKCIFETPSDATHKKPADSQDPWHTASDSTEAALSQVHLLLPLNPPQILLIPATEQHLRPAQYQRDTSTTQDQLIFKLHIEKSRINSTEALH